MQCIHQTQAVAWLLQQAQDSSSSNRGSKLSDSFHEECSWMMDQVVLRHLDVCFGVHQAVVVACVVYVTAKVTQAALPFSTITQVRTGGLLLCDCIAQLLCTASAIVRLSMSHGCSATLPCLSHNTAACGRCLNLLQAVSSCPCSALAHLFTDTELAVGPLQCGDLRAFYNSRCARCSVQRQRLVPASDGCGDRTVC